jgi:hypothetical protein
MIVVAQKRDVQSHLAGNAVVAAKVRRPAAKLRASRVIELVAARGLEPRTDGVTRKKEKFSGWFGTIRRNTRGQICVTASP